MKVDKWSGNKKISVQHALIVLNRALGSDRIAITKLVEARVNINTDLINDPSVQSVNGKAGMLGVINGLFGTDHNNYGPIAAEFDEHGIIARFKMTATETIDLMSDKARKDYGVRDDIRRD